MEKTQRPDARAHPAARHLQEAPGQARQAPPHSQSRECWAATPLGGPSSSLKPKGCGPEQPAHLGRGAGLSRRVSQTRLLTHSDGDVVVPVVLGDQGHHRPVQGWVGGVDRDELFRAELGEPVHPNGVAHGIGQEEHLHLRKRANRFAEGSHAARGSVPLEMKPCVHTRNLHINVRNRIIQNS
uniref:Uncharacterized protein n=1 Tax=Suricata suricatta TaxID=37032 RepID=A0A673T733_SURSU